MLEWQPLGSLEEEPLTGPFLDGVERPCAVFGEFSADPGIDLEQDRGGFGAGGHLTHAALEFDRDRLF